MDGLPPHRGGAMKSMQFVLFFLSFFVSIINATTSPIVEIDLPALPAGYDSSTLPLGKPKTPPSYMVNNQGNTFRAAPDKGSLNSPITSDAQLSSFAKAEKTHDKSNGFKLARRTSDFWMNGITHGVSPFAPSDYEFYRNVMDYGATGDGSTDDTAAINRAISDGNRCGESCGSTSVLGALVYFPAGTYVVSTPIIQYYYSQFVGDPNDMPVIKGSENFTGIALIDTDPYIPGGNGDQWYINQNQFYRQIRNFEFDLTAMNWTNYDDGQEYVPTGLHWQVAQATSLQNLKFTMPVSTATETTTAVGIFMENGSGGFLSDIEFTGGNIGFRAGTQQYTARDLTFTSCLTGISMIWDWGFTWKNLNFQSVWVAFDCTSIGGTDNQGTGSISVLDSTFDSVPYPITLRNGGPYPDILLDNLYVTNSASVVLISGGDTLFEGTSGEIYVTSWAYGKRYTSLTGNGTSTYGLLDPAPQKPESLLDPDGDYFVKSRPQYETYAASDFIVATANGVSNDATGDQSSAINTLLSDNVGSPIFFPAGIYQVQSTVEIPVGSIIVGEGWSQIMGTGSYFEDELNPQVMVKVGSLGDSGIIQISDMLFTVKGPTAGAILMEWNVHESTQGSAAMWDSHFRVGGANGTDLQTGDCPKLTGSVNKDCMAASMLLHLTSASSGYFENIWAWVADHDLDAGSGNSTTTTATQIDIYVGRGVLVESQGPVWFYGCASEHSILYQYQLSEAKDIFMGHIQTETPYFQASPDATSPYTIGTFDSDPTFEDCASGSSCAEAWALQILNSEDVFIYSAGLYSFFSNYDQSCLDTEDCQQSLVQTSYTQGLWLYNLFTIGATQMITPAGGVIPPTYQSDNDDGYSTEISAWLVLAEQGADIGSSLNPEVDGSGVVYIDPIIFGEPNPTVQCYDPCTLVMPYSTLPDGGSAIFNYGPATGTVTITITDTDIVTATATATATISGSGSGSSSGSGSGSGGGTRVVTVSTVVTPTPETKSVISFWDVVIPSGLGTLVFNMTSSWQPPAQTIFYSGYTGIFTPPAQSSNYGVQMTTESENTVLPTTVVTSNGVTQTWSEAQVTSLSAMKTTTTTTSYFTENSVGTQTSTTTLIPIIIPINSGGFYWSPIPLPTDPAFPFPKAPGFPDIPTPACFKFLDLFSIDCPPNDNKSPQTTHYTRGANSPTCTTGCGHLPSSSGSSSSSSSSCTTQTVTSCRTYTTATPYQTVCASYEGCECVTKTVTDYDVSCGLSTCTTTASSVKTGCYVTESVSTTGEYCVAGVTVASTDDQGENGISSATQTGSSTTYGESVVVGGSVYTPTSGEIVVGGNTISIPSISSLETTTIDGTTVVLIPEFTAVAASTTITDMLSGTVVVPGVTAAPTTASSTSTTAPATTTGTSTGTETYTEIFIIAFSEDDSDLEPYSWEYFAHAWDASWTACDGLGSYPLSNSDTLANEPYPDGTIDIGVDILGMSDCVYTGTKDTVGTFTCPDLSFTVQCYAYGDESTSTCYGELSPTEITPVVYCPW